MLYSSTFEMSLGAKIVVLKHSWGKAGGQQDYMRRRAHLERNYTVIA